VGSSSRKLRIFICFLVILFALALLPGAEINPALAEDGEEQFHLSPPNPELLHFLDEAPEPFYGYIPPPMDLSHLDKISVEGATKATSLPSRFDWRDTGKVTSIKDQNPCGTCWAHGTLAAVESRVLITKGVTYTPGDPNYDYSEQNLLCCTDPAWVYLVNNRCMGGGWSWLAADTLSKKGTRLESCQPYNTGTVDSQPCNDSCETINMITGFRMVAYQATSPEMIEPIKNAIYNHGPLAMSYHADGNDSHLYPGNIYYWPNCPNHANHLVCLIGWDDSIRWPDGSGQGAWIVKNSWGTGWAGGGYFYLCYGSASMCEVASLDYKDYDPNETIYYWDEVGQVNSFGCSAPSAWVANIFTASQDGTLTHVDFWTTSNNAAYEIYVYLDGDISNGLQNLAISQTGTCQEFGYYSIPLATPVSLTRGQPFTVAVKMTTPGYNYPLPVEIKLQQGEKTVADPPIQSGVSFARCGDGDAWTDLAGYQANACVRARVTSGVAPGHPDIEVAPSSFNVTQGPSTTQSYILTISNQGNASLTYSISDTAGGGPTRRKGSETVPLAASGLAHQPSSRAAPSSPPPATGIEIGYDDGTAEDSYWWSLGYAGGLFAVRFTPSQYPVTLKTARLYLEPYCPDDGHEQFAVRVYDDNGAGGAPGTLLGSRSFTASSWGWCDVDLSSLGITITSGDFYLAYQQLTEEPNCEALGADYDSPDGRSWAGYGGEWYRIEELAWPSDLMIRCVVEAAPTNNPPNVPCNPSPQNGATAVSPDVVLSWTGGDPDPGDTVTYDVYFGTASSPPLLSSHQTTTTYDPPGTLSPSTQYYWKIVAQDNHGASTQGPVWSFTTAAPDCPWLDENPKSGSVRPAGSAEITLTINTTGLTTGNTYTAQIVIGNNDPDENPKIVPVTLHVTTAMPTISFAPSSFAFAGTQGGSNPPTQTLQIWNSGSGTLGWSVSDNAAWLSLSPTTGSSTGETDTVIVSVDISGMTAGSYNATITISAPGATNTPQTVPVNLTISPPACNDNPSTAAGFASISDKLLLAYGFKSGEGTGGWTIYNPAWSSSNPEWNTLTTLYKRRGYWVKVSQSCTLVYGSNTYYLDAGWNLIGWTGC